MRRFNARAYYACVQMLREDTKDKGYEEYDLVIKSAMEQFGEYDQRTTGFHCYFAVHFIDIGDWKHGHLHLDHISSVESHRSLELFEKETIYKLLADYVRKVLSVPVDSMDDSVWLSGNALSIHKQQLSLVDQINTEMKESANKENQGPESIKCSGAIAPLDLLSVLVEHVKLFLHLGQLENARKILDDVLVRPGSQWILNAHSRLMEEYLGIIGRPNVQISDVEIMVGLWDRLQAKQQEMQAQ